jgi:hypothetical protein
MLDIGRVLTHNGSGYQRRAYDAVVIIKQHCGQKVESMKIADR